MPRTRLDEEREALEEYFPQFRIQDPFGPKRGVIGTLSTNGGGEYVIFLALGAFPNDAPRAYVVQPEGLTDCHGRLLSRHSMSRLMHLRQPDDYGHPQICHYNDQFWHPDVSLFKILMKVRLWLEAYEQHKRHGKPIDAYLSHMED